LLIRLRRLLGFLLAAAIGYALASTVVTGVVGDLYHMAAVYLTGYRLRAGAGGTIWILLAGFLLGQAVVLTARRLLVSLAPKATEWAEEAAGWDSALLLPTRFGVQRFLNACAKWAARESSESTQSIALLKIMGLGKLNDARGTRVATELLQRVASELRATALPTDASKLSKLLARHLPPRFALDDSSAPKVRCAARWSGSTFALAFRGLEVHAAFIVIRELAAWIRAELAAVGPDAGLELRVAFVMAPQGASARSVVDAAGVALSAADNVNLTVAVEPKDGRAPLFATVADLRRVDVPMAPVELPPSTPDKPAVSRPRLAAFVRGWGPVLACVLGVPLVMAIGAGKSDFERGFPWPLDLKSVPVVDATGTSQVNLVHQNLKEESADGWKVSNALMTQAEPGNAKVKKVEFRVDVTNLSTSARYVSMFDFVAIDAAGNEYDFNLSRVMKYAQPLDGRWLDPGETWQGWMFQVRKDAPMVGLVFRPSDQTRLVLRAAE
jgi:GGDEF domain-containing protein